jgi:DNA-binding GntR family transcriptional regulator
MSTPVSKSLNRGRARSQYLYRQISDQLRKDIKELKYPPLSRVPSMDDLAIRYKVNKITVRKALTELRAEGLFIVFQRRERLSLILPPFNPVG